MKKLISCLTSLALLACLLSGCSASTSDAGYQSGYDAGYAAGYKAARAEQSSAASEESVSEEPVSSKASSPEESSSEESESEETAEPEIGTRKNPVPLSTEFQTAVSPIFGGEGIAAFTVSEVVRGQDAEDMIAEANMYNDPAPDGMEYVLAYVTVTFLKDQSGEDDPLRVNYYYFEGVSSDYAVQDRGSVVLPEPKLDTQIYEGATDSGWVLVAVPEGDTPIYMLFEDIWFALS